MSKKGRVILRTVAIIVAVFVQVSISVLYGFSNVQIPAIGCFAVWCVCAAAIYKLAEFSGVV